MRRCFLWCLIGCLGLIGCSRQEDKPEPADNGPVTVERIDKALENGAYYLIDHQSFDGSWWSEAYGQFKEGDALTPLAVLALLEVPTYERGQEGITQGIHFLTAHVQLDDKIVFKPNGLNYPVYTSALAVLALSHPEQIKKHRHDRDAWLNHLRSLQLTENLGWQPSDREYGGWGYAHDLPRKPKADELRQPLLESNLSATAMALAALQAAEVPATDPAFVKALSFVRSCQNFAEKDAGPFDDGGFFFIYDDPARNKAGLVETKPPSARPRFHSYGSASADGLRCLLDCGLKRDDVRVKAALHFLEQRFQPNTHPGTYAPESEALREAVYFYYCWSVSQAFRRAEVKQLQTPHGKVSWASALAKVLLARQQKDGSWANAAAAQREDDPLVATPLAMLALSACRRRLAEGP